MARIETLTAYKCKFIYLQRNNPLKAEDKRPIKEWDEPTYTFSNFVEDYKAVANNILIGNNTDRAILLGDESVECGCIGDCKRWHLVPFSGKQGKPITVISKRTKETQKFGSDAVALYDNQVFVYETDNTIIAIFHRQNGSGCKSVFLETANAFLHDKGLRLEMELLMPLFDSVYDAEPTKLTLQYTKSNISSDVADNINGVSKEKHVIRELGFTLNDIENAGVKRIVNDLKLGKISKEEAIVAVKAEVPNHEEYNSAMIKFKIGNRSKSVSMDDIDKLLGIHDITHELHEAFKVSGDFVGELTKLSDDYYIKILEELKDE